MDNNEQKWQSFLQSKPIEIQQLAKGLRTLGFDYYINEYVDKVGAVTARRCIFAKTVETTDRVRNTLEFMDIAETMVAIDIDCGTEVELEVTVFNKNNNDDKESILSIQGVRNLVTIEAILETAYKIKL